MDGGGRVRFLQSLIAARLTGEPRLGRVAPGSMMYCLEDGKVYVKTSAGSWEAAT